MNPRWEIAEFEHHPHDWPHARRCIVARRRIEETDPQPTLFTLEHSVYRAWHTNLPLTPAGVWHFYDGRAEMEPRIRELREDYALRKIPTRAFAANALYLEVVRLAYNLVTAFQRTWSPRRMAKPDLEQTTLQTLLAAGRTYTPAEPTYSSVREFAPHPKVGGWDTPSDS